MIATRRLVSLAASMVLAGAAHAWAAGETAWVGSWAASPMPQDRSTFSEAPRLSGTTLQQVVHLSAGGSAVRVRLDNAFGEKAMVVRSVRVGLGTNPTDAQTAATFGGEAATTISGGAPLWSDPIALKADAGADLSVTIEFGQVPTVVTGHSLSVATSHLTPDATTQPATQPANVYHWFVLDGVDVRVAAKGAVVCFGDSITDGYRSSTDANRRWPDVLAKRLAGDSATANVGVLNEGISGNRLTDNGIGPSALARFDRDVLGQTGVKWVVLLEGINDIGTDRHPSDGQIVKQLELADRQIVERAHAHGIKVYGATVLPFVGAMYASPEKEKNRVALNDWIRTGGVFDAVIDFDAATRDPADASKLLAVYDSDDHLHPNDAGYQKMGQTVDLKLFTP